MAEEEFKVGGNVHTNNMTSVLQSYKATGTIFSDSTPSYRAVDVQDIYTALNKSFELDLTVDQLNILDELYNSGDESNRLVAAGMFKGIVYKAMKEELKDE